MIIKLSQNENIIEKIADHIMKNDGGNDLSGIVAIFPNKRPSHYFIKYLSEKLNGPFLPPAVFSISGFVNYISQKINPGVGIIEELDKVWLLFEVINKLKIKSFSGNFSGFYMWGLRIFNVIDEIDICDVENDSLKSLHSENIPPKLLNILANLGEIRDAFRKELRNRNLTTAALNFKVVSENISEEHLKDYKSIYLCGIFEPLRLEQKILNKLRSLKNTITVVRNSGNKWKTEGVFIYSAFDTHSQVRKVGEILSEDFDPDRTAVILPQSDALIPLLSEVVGKLEVDYNVTMGYPLVRTPVYTFLETIIRLEESRVGNEYYMRDYLSVIFHPYVKNILSALPIRTEEVEDMISSRVNKAFCSLDEIESILGQSVLLSGLHKELTISSEEIRTFRELAVKFANILKFIITESLLKTQPFGAQYTKKFFELFEKMKKTMFSDKAMEPPSLFELFRYFISTETIPFSGTPLGGLQILGMLEIRNLSFDKVIVLDVNERIVPNISKHDPILPPATRMHLGLPTYREREKVFRKNFMNLVNSAREVHLIYSEHSKDTRSRYIEEIIWEKQMNSKSVESEESEVSPVFFRIDADEKRSASLGKSENTMRLLSDIELSPTAIDVYLNCPARFYFSSLLNFKEREDVQRDPDASRIGRCLHSILDEFFRPFVGKKLNLSDEDKNRLLELMDFHLKNDFGEIRGEIYLLRDIVKNKLLSFFDFEKNRRDCEIIATEVKLRSRLELEGETFVRLKGRADRLDRRCDDFFIVDYKSGEFKTPLKNLDGAINDRKTMRKKIKSFQLPVYVFLFWRENPRLPLERINAEFYSIREIEEVSIFKNNAADAMNGIFLPSLKALISGIFDPKTPFERDSDDELYCRNCPYSNICVV